MLFNSLQFLIFLPIVLLICFILPKKVRYLWMLASSYYFYMCWNAGYGLLLLACTLVTYFGALGIEWCNKQENSSGKKKIVTAGILINIGLLGYFKYTDFLLEIGREAFALIGVEWELPKTDILLPVGISFFTFQALSYLIDVYRGDTYAEKNFFRYALFVSFFPQLVAGPIERSKNLLKQLKEPPVFQYENMREGIWMMLYGFFLKIVLADRIAVYVDTAYGNYAEFSGIYLIIAALLFAIQLYCDFYGYSVIAMGTAKLLGYRLMDNFHSPFYATSIEELWRRWHISLNTWFRDYLYIPLGGNRKGKVRQYVNKVIVFFVSGLWHGANWSFVIWGMLNGMYQLLGQLFMPVRNRVVKVFGLDRSTFSHRLYQRVVTFLLFAFSGIFFRAADSKEAIEIIKGIAAQWNPWILFDGSLYKCGLDQKNFQMMLLGIMILFTGDYFKDRGRKLRTKIMAQEAWFRILLASFTVLALLLFGIWGTGYEKAGFIYFQF